MAVELQLDEASPELTAAVDALQKLLTTGKVDRPALELIPQLKESPILLLTHTMARIMGDIAGKYFAQQGYPFATQEADVVGVRGQTIYALAEMVYGLGIEYRFNPLARLNGNGNGNGNGHHNSESVGVGFLGPQAEDRHDL